MRRLAVAGVLTIAALAITPVASADTIGPITFEPPGYSVGNIDGQQGWSKTGPYDVAVAGGPPAAFAFGTQSLRISNSYVDGAFGGQAFSPSTLNDAGEATADTGGYSGGTRQPRYDASFSFGSFTPGAEQTGLSIQVAPDRGDGARSWDARIKDTPTGLQVQANDLVLNAAGTANEFAPSKVIATGLDRTKAHTLRITIDYNPGPTVPNAAGNDIVRVFVDGALVHTTTTWEQYYRFDPEQAGGGNKIPTADSLLFLVRTSDGAVPALAGKGLLVDGVKVTTGPKLTCVEETGGYQENGLLSKPVHGVDALLGSGTGNALGGLVHHVNCDVLVTLGL